VRHFGNYDSSGRISPRLGINEDDHIHRSEASGQLGCELMASNHLGVINGKLRKVLGDQLANPIVTPERIAITDDERLTGHNKLSTVQSSMQAPRRIAMDTPKACYHPFVAPNALVHKILALCSTKRGRLWLCE
jgi:hypothetical protein